MMGDFLLQISVAILLHCKIISDIAILVLKRDVKLQLTCTAKQPVPKLSKNPPKNIFHTGDRTYCPA